MVEDKKALIQRANEIMAELHSMPAPQTLSEAEVQVMLQRRETLWDELDRVNADLKAKRD